MDDLVHYSVLLKESIDLLNIKEDGIYVDCTLGGGGHSEEILKRLTTGHLYAFDQDEYAINKAKERLNKYQDKLTIIKANFKDIDTKLKEFGVDKVDGILYDLGVSSFQLDDSKRGFSYRYDAKLDMRMDQDNNISAYEIVNNYSYEELKKILYEYGEEKYAPNIAKSIINNRPINTTLELVEIIKKALPSSVLRKSSHPAKKSFQAIRIAVNDELNVLKISLKKSANLLNNDGRIVVISFHSLEDKIVKNYFKDLTTIALPKDLPFLPDGVHIDYEIINKKVIMADEDELDENHRSHSAKLRCLKHI